MINFVAFFNANIDKSGPNVGFEALASTLYTVEQNVHISAFYDAFVSFEKDVALVNFGGVFSSHTAVDLHGTDNQLVNEAGGSIAGPVAGVETGNDNGQVVNFGTILGLPDIPGNTGIIQTGNFGSIDNRGYISGDIGIDEEASVSGAHINNSGRIEGSDCGIKVGLADAVASIINTGTIAGSIHAGIEIDAGKLDLVNAGMIVADVWCQSGENDSIVNSGSIAGKVLLGSGDDTFSGAGGTSGKVFGGDGNDVIIGGPAGDVLSGDGGSDTLTGGPGTDHFVFSAALNAATNVDRITDFSVVADRIELDHTVFGGIGAAGTVLSATAFYKGHHAHDATDHIIYNKTTGALYYDANGNAPGGEVKFAVLGHNLALTHSDFLVI
jgi:Ca2+-binding RTX toxin-like protein